MTFKVANVFGAPGMDYAAGENILRGQGGESAVIHARSEEDIVSFCQDADAVIGLFTDGMQTFSGSSMARLPRLKLVAGLGIGYEGVDLAGATEHGICVVNAPDYCLEEMANHTIALLLVLSKKIVPVVDAVRAGKWNAAGVNTIRTGILPPMFRVSKQTLGLVGFGNIPRAVVPRARALGLTIVACDPFVSAPVMHGLGVEPVDLDTLLRRSDYISVHAALNQANRHMFGLDQFRKMKPTAYFINTARGGLVDEDALYMALKEKVIAGAALDAMEPQPPRADNPLMRLPNCVITAHVGQYSQESQEELLRSAYEEAVRLMMGGWPRDIAFRNPQVKAKYASKWGRTQER